MNPFINDSLQIDLFRKQIFIDESTLQESSYRKPHRLTYEVETLQATMSSLHSWEATIKAQNELFIVFRYQTNKPHQALKQSHQFYM